MILPERKIVKTRGGQISYRENGSGPVLLLLHGIGGNSRSWRNQFSALAKQFHVIAWDAPAYGKSAGREANVREYTNAVLEFMTALKISSVNLLGHSMGGVVAQGVAGANPDRVNKLILSSTFMGHGSSVGSPLGEGYLSRLNDIKNMSPEDFGMARAASMLTSSVSIETKNEVASIAAEVTYSGLLAGCKMLHHADTRGIVENLKLPVLVLTGEKDRVVIPSRSEEIATLISGAESKQITGVGHAGYLGDSKEFNSVIENFLSL